MVKVVWAGLGLGLLAIGLVGIALPLVPTTPFVLLAGSLVLIVVGTIIVTTFA